MSQYPLHYVLVTNALCNSNHYSVTVTISLSQDPLLCPIVTISLCHSNHYCILRLPLLYFTLTITLYCSIHLYYINSYLCPTWRC